jgi:co-chaperonin GroES (HSP10)
MKAVGQYILIDKIEEEIQSAGFVLTGEEKRLQRFRKGKIISKGNEVTEVLNSGDVVYFDVANSFDMLIEGKNVTIIRQRDIICGL